MQTKLYTGVSRNESPLPNFPRLVKIIYRKQRKNFKSDSNDTQCRLKPPSSRTIANPLPKDAAKPPMTVESLRKTREIIGRLPSREGNASRITRGAFYANRFTRFSAGTSVSAINGPGEEESVENRFVTSTYSGRSTSLHDEIVRGRRQQKFQGTRSRLRDKSPAGCLPF